MSTTRGFSWQHDVVARHTNHNTYHHKAHTHTQRQRQSHSQIYVPTCLYTCNASSLRTLRHPSLTGVGPFFGVCGRSREGGDFKGEHPENQESTSSAGATEHSRQECLQ